MRSGRRARCVRCGGCVRRSARARWARGVPLRRGRRTRRPQTAASRGGWVTKADATAPGPTDPHAIRPAKPPRVDARIDRIDPPDGTTNRWFYEHVGAPHDWTDHAGRTDADWQAWAEQVETWVATVDGERAGYYELHETD